MGTPSYKGSGQPQADNSFWSGFGSWFGGGGTPAYKGDGQPSSASSGFLGGATPAYKPAPNVGANAIAQAIDPSSLPQGPVMVFVPRGTTAPCEVTAPQDDDQQQQ